MKQIPQQPNLNSRLWNQQNESDLVGNVFVTKNISFDQFGYLRLGYSPRAAIDESVDSDFDNAAVILYSENYGYFVGTWDDCFQVNTNILSVTPTQITTSGVPTGDIESDATWFGGLMVFTQDNDVDYYNPSGGTWTDTNISLTGSGQHPVVNFLSRSALAVADVNTVKLYASPITATPTLITTLTINADFRITGMCYFNQNLYIATHNVYGGHAFMYVWNGLGTAANQVYEVDSNIIFSICAHQDGVWVITGNGSLMRFNGGSFEIKAAFPIFYTDQALTDQSNIQMYKNIMKSNGNLLYILFSNIGNNKNRLLSQPDGIWCYDERVGLYHRYSVSNSRVIVESIAQASVNTTTNQITVSNNYITGTEVIFNEVFGLSPLVDGTKYYVIRIDSTHIQLATTYANALAGTPIDLISSGASNTFSFFPNVDFGQYWCERTTALNVIERPVPNRLYGTDIIWGAEVIRRNNTGDYPTLGTVADGISTRGYWISPKIFSDAITDTYNKIVVKFSKFVSELDKVIISYRNEDDMREYIDPSDWRITWTSTTTFTTTQSEWDNASVGDEVEILQGAGGGLCSPIVSVTENSGTYTVTITDSYDNYVAGDLGVAVFRNWKRWKVVEYGDSNAEIGFIEEHIGKRGKFIQLKIELQGVRTRIESVFIDNKERLPIKES